MPTETATLLVFATAVVAALLYLAAQVRRRAEQTRTNTCHQAFVQLSAWRRTLIADPETRTFLELALREPESVAEEDQILFSVLMSEYFGAVETLFLLFEQGTLDAEGWTHTLSNNLDIFGHRGARLFAGQRKGPLAERFWTAVSAELEEQASPVVHNQVGGPRIAA